MPICWHWSICSVAGSEKIVGKLGWKPRFPELRAIIETAWKWHMTHPKGYEDR